MRRFTLAALTLAVAALVIACSSSSSSSSAGGLTGKTWKLTAITEVTPAFQGVIPAADQQNYTIEFKTDGSFQAKADCNTVSGQYTTTSSGGLTLTLGPSTLVACGDASFGSQYVAALGNTASYAIAGGTLTITLKDNGTLVYI